MMLVRRDQTPRWVPNNGDHVTEQRLHDALDDVESRARSEHMKTRAWIVVLTAPTWGALIGATLGLQAWGTAAAAIGGTLYVLAAKFHLVFH